MRFVFGPVGVFCHTLAFGWVMELTSGLNSTEGEEGTTFAAVQWKGGPERNTREIGEDNKNGETKGKRKSQNSENKI